jgi:hypothetical protein
MSTPAASSTATGAAAASTLEADARLAHQLQREEEEQHAARIAASAGSRAAAAASSPAIAATASVAAACIASGLRGMSASDRAAALRVLLNDEGGGGGGFGLTFDGDTLRRRNSSNNRDDRTGRDSSGLFLGLQPSQGEEVAFYPSRVSGQQNRAALGLSVILSGDIKRCMMFNCKQQRNNANRWTALQLQPGFFVLSLPLLTCCSLCWRVLFVLRLLGA